MRLPCALARAQAGHDALLNPRPLEVGYRGEDARDEASRRCARVDALAERDERHVARLPFVE
jgi:hypothetical protein